MRKLIALLVVSYLVSFAALLALQPAFSASFRTYNSPHYPYRKLAKQFGGSVNSFITADPSPDGTPLTLTSATGTTGPDGTVTILMTNGFTAPVTLTAYMWHIKAASWVRVAPVSSGTNAYSQALDSHYTTCQFSIPENIPFLVRASAAVTGDVYTDAVENPNNANTAP